MHVIIAEIAVKDKFTSETTIRTIKVLTTRVNRIKGGGEEEERRAGREGSGRIEKKKKEKKKRKVKEK